MSLNQVQITTPEQVSLKYKIAGLGSRATAQILDWLILVLVYLALFFFLGLLTKLLPASFAETVNSYLNAIVLITLFCLLWGYFVLFEFFAAGRTPGKMLVGIRVIQDNGQSLTFLTSAIRNLVRIIDFLPVFYLLGILMIFFHSRHKRIGDLAAGTLVIYQRRTKQKKKKSPLEKKLEQRLAANPVQLELDEWTIRKFGSREWKLLDTYIKRRPSLPSLEQNNMTLQVAMILLPLLGMKPGNYPLQQVENTLFALYFLLKEEWQYEVE